ncbi:hypothetical protein J2S74_002322 [Evansella vedderi]|uniref:Autolysin n=1 Tax=Evansella vedderi TaxID=38282 RepID=A0ABT9ZUL5_9BACI|nr:N-acetylmuramoyl-L-alanine amidase [Evansella vedderi]MDQ0254940.1 hypothetical protein [Evansella vedderi]
MSTQDLRGTLMDLGHRRPTSNITKIALHWSGTKQGNAHSFQNHWRTKLGWNTGGYHKIVLTDGTLQHCYADNVVTNGVRGHNTTTLHICYVGDGLPNARQMTVLIREIRKWLDRYKQLKATDVLGHREFSGQNTACPGANMTQFRRELGTTSTPPRTPDVLGRDCSRLVCKGPLVKAFQENLLKLGEKLPRWGADGDFGAETEDATKTFQARHKLIVDGIAGTQTLSKVDELIRALPQPKPEPKKEEPFMLKQAIVINSFADYPAAERLANKIGAPIYTRRTAEKGHEAKELIVCGGFVGKLKAEKITDLSGRTLFDTYANIGKRV